jgi:hypothetical protein
MEQPTSAIRWESAGTQGIGVLVSDTLMFQRVAPQPSESSEVAVQPGTRALLLDVNYFKSSTPRILAASAKITAEHASDGSLAFEAEGIDQTNAVVCILSTKAPREIMVNRKHLDPGQYRQSGRTLFLHFVNTASPQQIQLLF